MKKVLLFLFFAGLINQAVIAQESDPTYKEPGEPYVQSNYPPLRSGGEDISSAVSIPTIPFADGGSTCGAANDYAASCGCCGGSTTAPDLVYAFTAGTSGTITIDLQSVYDNLLHIRDESNTVVACDDDSGDGLNSLITDFPVTAGQTYYIVVEGFSSACGDYSLNITGTATPANETPLSPWVIGLSIVLIGTFIVLRKTRVA